MSFQTITDLQLATDQPLTQAILRQFYENLKTHTHQSGQGGGLSTSSFGNDCVTNPKISAASLKFVNPGFGFEAVGSMTFNEATNTEFLQARDPRGDTFLDSYQYSLVASYPVVWVVFMTAEIRVLRSSALPNELTVDCGYQLDGSARPALARAYFGGQQADGIQYPEYVTNLIDVVVPTVQAIAHTLRPYYVGGSATNSYDVEVPYRTFSVREYHSGDSSLVVV